MERIGVRADAGSRIRRWAPVLVAGWVALVVTGFWSAMRYNLTPGAANGAPAAWPVGSALAHEAGRPTLVMFAHPRCPCTRASLVELGGILRPLARPPLVYVLFVRPGEGGADWEAGDTVSAARRTAGVHVMFDPEGREATRFGAMTSGQIVFYDSNARLRFSGGITGLRGEVGDNAGRRRLAAVLEGREPDKNESMVFGCALLAAEAGNRTAP